jgi:hypothetical protein
MSMTGVVHCGSDILGQVVECHGMSSVFVFRVLCSISFLSLGVIITAFGALFLQLCYHGFFKPQGECGLAAIGTSINTDGCRVYNTSR